MGLLRLYLALCIVAGHANSVPLWTIHDGRQAVQIFFIISGFYMELILSGKYQSKREFYASRFLRIFVPYWTILLSILLLSSMIGIFTGWWADLEPYRAFPLQKNGLAGLLFTAVSNFTLFFQDWVMFLTHDRGESLMFTTKFGNSNSPLFRYLIMPQAWSIGIELTFYMLAPFLHKLKTRMLWLLFALSISGRVITYELLNLQDDPWDYRFFPFELALFLLGMLGYRILKQWPLSQTDGFQCKKPVHYCLCGIALLVFFFMTARVITFITQFGGYHYVILLSYIGWALCIPILFIGFQKHRVDRLIGELSYPVYLIHMFVITLVRPSLPTFNIGEAALGAISAIVTVALACSFYYWVLQPFEAHRYKLAANLAKLLNRQWLPFRPRHNR